MLFTLFQSDSQFRYGHIYNMHALKSHGQIAQHSKIRQRWLAGQQNFDWLDDRWFNFVIVWFSLCVFKPLGTMNKNFELINRICLLVFSLKFKLFFTINNSSTYNFTLCSITVYLDPLLLHYLWKIYLIWKIFLLESFRVRCTIYLFRFVGGYFRST